MESSAQVQPSSDDVATLRTRLRGRLLEPGDDGYDAARAVWNGMIDRRPVLISCCAGTADVIESVGFARHHGLKLSVRGGGHNVAGYAVCDGGLMIDLSPMRAVRVDPATRRAWVQGGALWADVDCETTAFGLATPGGLVSQTGVAGLTLSGGIGWLRGRHGLCVDNLEAVDIVTADGRSRHADASEHADLFWAVRGGGGNFGVVTEFTFRLHPIPPALMFCGPAYPEAQASALIPLWRDFMAHAPEQLSSFAELSTIPDDPAYPEAVRGRRVISLTAVYDGAADEGEALVAPLRTYGTPLADFSGVVPVRHMLGAKLMKMNRPIEAATVYREDLRRNRGNGWSLTLSGRAMLLAELPKQTEHLAPNVAPYVWVWPFVGNPEAVVAECPVSNAWYLARPCRVATSKETPERRCRVGHRSWV